MVVLEEAEATEVDMREEAVDMREEAEEDMEEGEAEDTEEDMVAAVEPINSIPTPYFKFMKNVNLGYFFNCRKYLDGCNLFLHKPQNFISLIQFFGMRTKITI